MFNAQTAKGFGQIYVLHVDGRMDDSACITLSR